MQELRSLKEETKQQLKAKYAAVRGSGGAEAGAPAGDSASAGGSVARVATAADVMGSDGFLRVRGDA